MAARCCSNAPHWHTGVATSSHRARSGDAIRAMSVRSDAPFVPDFENSREKCFKQGKPCVYQPDGKPELIVTEWANGVIDRYDVERQVRTPEWPDGAVESRPAIDPITFPMWPRSRRKTAAKPRLVVVRGGNGAGKSTCWRAHRKRLPTNIYGQPRGNGRGDSHGVTKSEATQRLGRAWPTPQQRM